MTSSPIERLRDIVLTATSLEPALRAAYLDRVCAGDPSLRRQAERLMAAESIAVSEVEHGLDSLARAVNAELGADLPAIGQSVGPYRLERLLGVGGSGAVFEATQETPVRRRVAIKMLHHNRSLSADLARFRAEQQILANLNHPNIARVYDAGTTDRDVPYFVLELVEGDPITEYARSAGPDRDDRLDLCLQACRAAEHAHAKGVIHRDLKPSNILVSRTAEGPVVKVIDFGIARLRDPEPGEALTIEGLHLGTPEYMSPEQAGGRSTDCDVQSDVHALGNLLQELLCGKGVYSVGALSTSNQLRVVASGRRELATRDNDGRPLPTDLRRIIAAATEPDREQRYPTAAALADDIDRFRTRRPVLVRGAGTWYQLRKAAERHPVSAGLLAVLVLVVFGSLAALLSLNARERETARQARAETAKAEALVSYLTGVMQAASPQRMGREVTLVDAFEDAARRAEFDLADEPATLSHFLYIISQVETEIGNNEMALEVMARSDSALARDPQRTEDSRLHRMMARASIQRNLGNLADSDSLLQAVLESTRGHRNLAQIEAFALIDLGDNHFTRGEYAQAESTGAAAMAILEADPEEGIRLAYLQALRIRCRGLIALGSRKAAGDLLRAELAACESEFGPDHPATLGILSDLDGSLGSEDAAEKLAIKRRLLDICLRQLGPDHLGVAAVENNLAVDLMNSGQADEARPYVEDAERIWQANFGRAHPYLASARINLGFICYVTGDVAGAELRYREAMGIYDELDPHGFALPRCNLLSNLAACLLRQARLAEAETEVRRGLALTRSEDARHVNVARAHYTLGAILLAKGRVADALDAWKAAELVIATHDAADPYLSALIANGMGCALVDTDPERSRQLLAGAESQLFTEHRAQNQRLDALQRTADVLAARGETALAAKYARQVAYLMGDSATGHDGSQ